MALSRRLQAFLLQLLLWQVRSYVIRYGGSVRDELETMVLLSHVLRSSSSCSSSRLWVGDARGDYYGESSGSFMVKEFK